MNKKYKQSTLFVPALLLGGILVIGSCTKKDDTAASAPHISSFSPAGGIRGTFVVINGTNFSTTTSQNIVTFNGKKATVLSSTGTSLVVEVPGSASAGKITVKTGIGIDSSRDNFMYVLSVSSLARNQQAIITPSGLAIDASGNIDVVEQDVNLVATLTTTGVVNNLAGNTVKGFVDAKAEDAEFNFPLGLAIGHGGNIYVADAGNNRIRVITPAGMVGTLAGNGSATFGEGTGTGAKFNSPSGIATDAAGNIYVADAGNNRIRTITPAGVVGTLAGNGTPGVFNGPLGVAVDANGNVYVADAGNNRICKVTPAGTVSTLAGTGTAGFNDGAAGAAMFSFPAGLAVDGSGNVYVADAGNNRIRKITPAGVVSTVAGSGEQAGRDGAAPAAGFFFPYAIVTDASGVLYVADKFSNAIRKIQ